MSKQFNENRDDFDLTLQSEQFLYGTSLLDPCSRTYLSGNLYSPLNSFPDVN